MNPSRWSVALLVVLMSGCEVLYKQEAGLCGNAVIEAGEDCDSFPLEAGTRCLASGSPNACRLTCLPEVKGESAPACPQGWGCGVDGLCRQPSGEYAIAAEIRAGARAVALGDFDGDGRKDALTSSARDSRAWTRVRTHYFDDQGRLAQTNIPSAHLSSPVIVNLSARGESDSRDDLLTGYGGLLPWLGSEDRMLYPQPLPSYSAPLEQMRLIALDVSGRPVGSIEEREPLFLSLGVIEGMTMVINPESHNEPLVSLGDATVFEHLLGDPVVARFDERNGVCESFVLAFKDSPTITVFHPCERVGGEPQWRTDSGLAPVTLTLDGEKVSSGAYVADLNGDSHFDLLVGVADAKANRVRVAYGDSHGHFSSTPDLLQSDDKFATKPFALPVRRLLSGEIVEIPISRLPLDAADMNGDTVIDYVLPGGVALSRPETANAIPLYDLVTFREQLWTQAMIRDVNGDGALDVVASSDVEPNIDVMFLVQNGQLLNYPVTTDRPVAKLAVVDADGDLAKDIFFVERRTESLRGVCDLYVAFGRPFHTPEAPGKIGEMDGVQQLVAGFGDSYFPEQLAMLNLPEGESSYVTILLGSTDRLFTAPRLLAADSQDAYANVLVHTVGALGSSAVDVFVLATEVREDDAEYIITGWAAFGERGGLGTPIRVSMIAGEQTAEQPMLFEKDMPTLVTHGDLDGSGAAHIALVSALTAEGGSQGEAGTRVRIGKLVQNGPGWQFRFEQFDLSLFVTSNGQIEFVDADDDGHPDLVFANGQGDIRVFWNDGTNHFRADLETEAKGNAFAMIYEPARSTRVLAIADSTEVRVATFENRSLTEKSLVEGFTEVTGLAAGDLNGDGVEDLAVVDSLSLKVLLGKAVNQ